MGDDDKIEAVRTQRVKNIGISHFDLADGRDLGPGDYADDVNLEDPHNQRLVTAGLLVGVPTDRSKSGTRPMRETETKLAPDKEDT